jgi:hypothetical protein
MESPFLEAKWEAEAAARPRRPPEKKGGLERDLVQGAVDGRPQGPPLGKLEGDGRRGRDERGGKGGDGGLLEEGRDGRRRTRARGLLEGAQAHPDRLGRGFLPGAVGGEAAAGLPLLLVGGASAGAHAAALVADGRLTTTVRGKRRSMPPCSSQVACSRWKPARTRTEIFLATMGYGG